jgi:hypothetical protein
MVLCVVMLRVFAINILNIDRLCDVMLGRLFIVMLSVVLLSDVPLNVMFYYAEFRLFIVMLIFVFCLLCLVSFS